MAVGGRGLSRARSVLANVQPRGVAARQVQYLLDKRDRPVLGNWPGSPGEYHLLYDVTVDGREQADLADQQIDLLAAMKAAWTRIEAELLPYPPEHPGVPPEGLVASEPD